MAAPWIDQKAIKTTLEGFFQVQHTSLSTFGNTVNQTFEAFVFAAVVKWYQRHDWTVQFRHPVSKGLATKSVRLKFSTRGRPENYTYAVCTKDQETIEIRHGLRVATRFYRHGARLPANIVLDVAVIRPTDLSKSRTDDAVDNNCLITFGEAKHMSAFAELVAGFLGLVHEMIPEALRVRASKVNWSVNRIEHPLPFLYVSGKLYRTAEGIVETIQQRSYYVRVYDGASEELYDEKLPVATRSPGNP